MGLFSFIKNAGEKIFGKKKEEAKPTPTSTAEASKEATEAQQEKSKIEALKEAVKTLNLPIENMTLELGQSITVTGKAATNADREKVILALGNVEGITVVEDHIEVTQPEPESKFYTVKKGDSLSKIAGEFYGDVKAYPIIFEANKPMLSDPNKIYPGQVLRIPAKQ